MAAPLTWEDLKVFEPDFPEGQAVAMIATTWARVVTKIAPCLAEEDAFEPESDQEEAIRGIIRDVVLRWYDSGSGVVDSHTAGDYSESLNQYRGGRFRPEEISDLQKMCATFRGQTATTIPVGYGEVPVVQHATWCNLYFDDSPPEDPFLCDCGAELTSTGLPLWLRNPTP